MKRSDLLLTFGQRVFLFFCMFIVCLVLSYVLSYVVGRVLSGNLLAAMRISTIIQDVVAFVIPPVATALIVCRRPDRLLGLQSASPAFFFLIIAMQCCSLPLQQSIITWNQNLTLPESMAGFEAFARSLDELARQSMSLLFANTSVGSLTVNILVVAIAAGFSEELLFRGGLQRLLITGGANKHVAIWSVALLFSLMHMQFYGLVPRLLLGAYFGYLMLWSGSVWVPVSAHVLNNLLYVVTAWLTVRKEGIEHLDNVETMTFPLWLTLCSLVVTVLILIQMHRLKCNDLRK